MIKKLIMNNIIRAVYRPAYKPLSKLPFGARSVGHYRVDENYSESGTEKFFTQLFWCIEGRGKFYIDDLWYTLEPGEISFYFPGDEHRFRSLSDFWNYRWLTIDGKLGREIVEHFGFRKTPQKRGSCPENLFVDLQKFIRENTPEGQAASSSAVYSILSYASVFHGEKDSLSDRKLIEQCVYLIRENFSNSSFGVNELAAMLEINRSRISRLFRAEKGISLQNYIIACRIQKGMSLLKESSLPIAKCAEKSGYSSLNYFSKSINKVTGHSPAEFRKI